MMIENKPISRSNQRIIAVGCLVLIAVLLITAWVKGDTTWFLAAGVIGIPLIMLSLSLLFGNASKNKGIFTPLMLNFMAVLLCVVYGLFVLNDEYINPIFLSAPVALFVLAKQRKNN